MTALLVDAASAYRTARERYVVRRRTVGERTIAGHGTVSIQVVDVLLLEDGSLVCSSDEAGAKAWLDQICLRAALERLLTHPNLAAKVGAQPLQLVHQLVLQP